MANKTTNHTPPGQSRPAAPEVPTYRPEGYWSCCNEERFYVLASDKIQPWDRERGAFREYDVFGLKAWQNGPRASKLSLSRHWTLRLLRADGKLLVEGQVLLYPENARIVGGGDPGRGIVVRMPLSTPEDDAEVRHLKRSVFRLAAWAGERLAISFEEYLEARGL